MAAKTNNPHEDFRLAQGRLMLCAAQLGDANVGAEQVRALIAEMRNAEQVLLANCDHVCHPDSTTERLRDAERSIAYMAKRLIQVEKER